MTKKKMTPQQSRAERKHLKRAYSKPIKEIFSNVANIHVSYTTSLNETGGWKEKPSGPHNYGPESEQSFEYDCPCIDCLGSFDLENEISELIVNHTSSYSGQKICQFKVRGHPCWVHFDYKINIDYKK